MSQIEQTRQLKKQAEAGAFQENTACTEQMKEFSEGHAEARSQAEAMKEGLMLEPRHAS